ncbi:MAG: hypothetical protein JNM84_03980 [Planctomycetes bacterium]|nr:hypothetical protein [Planctomycetota bacterium]
MDIATSAFASRLPSAADQLRLAFELGLQSIALVRTDPTVQIDGLTRALEDSGGRIGAIEAATLSSGREGEMLCVDLASPDGDRRAAAIQLLERHIALAAELHCPRLVLQPAPLDGGEFGDRVRRVGELARSGEVARTVELREEIEMLVERTQLARLDRFCRTLHALSRKHPRVHFAFATAPGPGWFPDLRALGFVFEDLRAHELHYWHDAAVAQLEAKLRGGAPWDWLERLGGRLSGCYLGDAEGWNTGRILGSGEVDFRELKAQLPHSARRVLRLEAGQSRQSALEGIRMVRVLDLDV